jgi:hypothetical protein
MSTTAIISFLMIFFRSHRNTKPQLLQQPPLQLPRLIQLQLILQLLQLLQNMNQQQHTRFVQNHISSLKG